MAASQALYLSGYRELLRSFDSMSQEGVDIRHVFAAVGEPIARHATGLAIQRIPRITTRLGNAPWAQNRVGVTVGGIYVVPKKRGTTVPRRKRPNFGELLLERAYDPTLAAFEPLLEVELERALGRLERVFERAA